MPTRSERAESGAATAAGEVIAGRDGSSISAAQIIRRQRPGGDRAVDIRLAFIGAGQLLEARGRLPRATSQACPGGGCPVSPSLVVMGIPRKSYAVEREARAGSSRRPI